MTIRHNTITACGGQGINIFSSNGAVSSPGDRLIIEENDIHTLTDQDPIYVGGNYVVIRNNYIHDYGTARGVHLDAIQSSGQQFSTCRSKGM